MPTTDPLEADGLYDGRSKPWLPPDLYHANTSRHSRTELVRLLRSAHEWHYFQEHPEEANGTPTPQMIRGSAAHAAILEPDRFLEAYALEPDFGPKNRKEPREQFEAWLATQGDRTIVPKKESAAVLCIALKVREHPTLRAVLVESQGLVEPTACWTVKVEGHDIRLRCRPDRVNYPDEPVVIDVKTVQDPSPEAFDGEITARKLHIQAAMYLDGMTQSTGVLHDRFVFIVFQAKPPYGCGVHTIDDESVEIGRIEYRRALERLVEVAESGIYHDFAHQPNVCGLRGWYRDQFRNR